MSKSEEFAIAQQSALSQMASEGKALRGERALIFID
jgi:hypothetical protein